MGNSNLPKQRKRNQGQRAQGPRAPERPRRKSWRIAAVLGLLVLAVAATLIWKAQKLPDSASDADKAARGSESPVSSYKLISNSLSDATLERMAAEKKNEGSAAVWNARANELLKAGQMAPAIQAYKQAIALSPKDEDLHFNLGIAYAKSGDLTNAENEYLEALRLLPDYPEVHNNLGNVLMREGRVADAEQHFEEALKQMPEYAQAQNNMGILRQQQKRPQEALGYFQKAVEFDTNYWEAHFNLANTYLRLNEQEKGMAELRETLRLKPDFEIARRMLNKVTGTGTNSPVEPPKAP